MKQLLFIYVFFILLLEGCLPAPTNARRLSNSLTATAGKTVTTTTAPTFLSDENQYWFSSTKITGTITINKDSKNIYYLRGKNIHDFLSAQDANLDYYYNKQYCLIGTFPTSNLKQLRVRAIPLSTTTLSGTTTVIERMLRIDFPSDIDNQAACQKSTINSILPTSAAYSLPNVSTQTTGGAVTTKLELYINNISTASLTSLLSTTINLNLVFLNIDFSSSSISNTSSCSNAACSTLGFDCCIEGQCVIDGALRPNGTSAANYTQAKSEVTANPLNFINWPNIYYVCTNVTHSLPTNPNSNVPLPTPISTTPLATAQDRVKAYLIAYQCFQEVATSGTYNSCLDYNTGTTVESTSSRTSQAYDKLKFSTAVSCGCNATTIPEVQTKCPTYTVKPVYNSIIEIPANITDFYCYIPPTIPQSGAITNLNVFVNARTAPHRFYDINGKNYDDIAGLSSSIIQEGDDFSYLDELNKMGPVSTRFNPNALLGRMVVDLSKTSPAKMIAVEFGKTYILTTTSGTFTPCPLCARDSWYQSFFSRPAVTGGTGLRYSGYSTTRDAYGNNDTFGNYEDTHFGRACFVPLTMLPFTHQKNASLQTQRLNRLKTQSAYYINGLQRDWYGFNQGAMIGSFDGVQWFAIGSGRRVTSTSTKLFLAYNGSFLDLASRTDSTVNIIPDMGNNMAANLDFDPTLTLTDKNQNMGATCQKFHQCDTDTDCIANLGWEYVCAEVSQVQTTWPVFDSNGNELANQETNSTLFGILSNTTYTGNTKRCVYRGAGAPCKVNYSTLTSPYSQKLMTCAPNFYCAKVDTASFNEEAVRSPNEFDNILYGFDTNVLGRPLKYVGANKTLTTEIISNIKYVATKSLKFSSTETADAGICRPGKKLSSATTTELSAHGEADPTKRTDFISQIGSCDSGLSGNYRAYSCPTIGADLNYAPKDQILTISQNSCGKSSLYTNATTNVVTSTFKSIEAAPLTVTPSLFAPTLAQDACLRKAGSVCHTDLDCGPNIMHENIANTLSVNYFGGTQAEKSYWSESLICAQLDAAPLKNSSSYLTYSLSQNRCCRDTGKDFTMYTKGTTLSGNLDTAQFTYLNPNASNRYSRYEVSPEALNNSTEIPKIDTTTHYEPASKQWKVLNETGSKTCCGGGYIRKFADGTHTWPIGNRLTIDTSNFSCLNYRSPLANANVLTNTETKSLFYTSSPPTSGQYYSTIAYQYESSLFCLSPFDGGCLQIPYANDSGFTITAPSVYNNTTAVLDTTPTANPFTTSNWTQTLNTDVPYMPIPVAYSNGVDSVMNPNQDPNAPRFLNFFTNPSNDYSVSFYLPAYIGNKTIDIIQSVKINYVDGNGNITSSAAVYGSCPADAGNCDASGGKCSKDIPPAQLITTSTDAPYGAYCITYRNNRPVIIIGAAKYIGAYSCPNDSQGCDASNICNSDGTTLCTQKYTFRGSVDTVWSYAGVQIAFKPMETVVSPPKTVTTPGNTAYYLTKLGRLDLLGIPQITYEPLYCNNDRDKVVPGIFKSIPTRSEVVTSFKQYSSPPYTITEGPYGNNGGYFSYADKVDHPAIFAEKDFACCTPLGKTPKNGNASCCSGFAMAVNGKNTCALPSGTDLHVYFNRFVSNEGTDPTGPGGGLIESDFNDYTGEPAFNDTTYQKINALGVAYCPKNTYSLGEAFGQYRPEPFSGTYQNYNTSGSYITSIIDSVLDINPTAQSGLSGKLKFDRGYRWNHHFYCD